jgi:hypothetical protein
MSDATRELLDEALFDWEGYVQLFGEFNYTLEQASNFHSDRLDEIKLEADLQLRPDRELLYDLLALLLNQDRDMEQVMEQWYDVFSKFQDSLTDFQREAKEER